LLTIEDQLPPIKVDGLILLVFSYIDPIGNKIDLRLFNSVFVEYVAVASVLFKYIDVASTFFKYVLSASVLLKYIKAALFLSK
jgi:hypothetical protein